MYYYKIIEDDSYLGICESPYPVVADYYLVIDEEEYSVLKRLADEGEAERLKQQEEANRLEQIQALKDQLAVLEAAE